MLSQYRATAMEISVLLEPIPAGFRASTQSPVALSAEGVTESKAMEALSDAFYQRLQGGCQLRSLHLLDIDAIQAITARMRNNPMFSEFETAIEDYRKVANAVPDPDAD